MAHAAGGSPQQGHGQVWGLFNLIEAEAEQIAVGQGGGLVGLHIAHRLAEGFVRSGQTEQQLVAVDGNGAQFHHPPHH